MIPFSLILNLLTHYFHKTLDPIGSKFVSRAEPRYRIFHEVQGGGGEHFLSYSTSNKQFYHRDTFQPLSLSAVANC